MATHPGPAPAGDDPPAGEPSATARRPLSPFVPWMLFAAVGFAAAIRIGIAVSLPYLHGQPPEGLLKSDPGLIHYVTSRIVEAGGWIPDDFRADPLIEHPELVDVPAMFTVGQEFLIAWVHLLTGGDVPLHSVAIFVMGLIAALAAVGVFALARELSGSDVLAGGALLLYLLAAANYRTIGFIFIREDLALPLLALHLWLLARAARLGGVVALLLAALSAAAALATWHATTFVYTVGVACVFAWFLRTGRSPLAGARAWIFPLALAVLALAIPVLRAKGFVLSLPMLMLGVMWAAPRIPAWQRLARLAQAGASLAALALLAGAAARLGGAIGVGSSDYAHVLELMLAKLVHLGQRPADPLKLSFDARMLWQGPFTTGSPERIVTHLGISAFLVPVAALASLPGWLTGRGDARRMVAVAFAAALLVLALLVDRLLVVAGLVAPVVAVELLRGLPRPSRPTVAAWVAGLGVVQLALFANVMSDIELRQWYDPAHQHALRETIAYVRRELSDDGAIAADFVNSTALLTHTRHPVVLQPKYETLRSRRRIQRFETSFFHDDPDTFRRVLRDEFAARYLLVAPVYLWFARYEAGIPESVRRPGEGTASEAFLSVDPEVYTAVPGYRLLFESHERPPRIRLYEIVQDG